jgi:hypothetical protein
MNPIPASTIELVSEPRLVDEAEPSPAKFSEPNEESREGRPSETCDALPSGACADIARVKRRPNEIETHKRVERPTTLRNKATGMDSYIQ